MTGKANTFPPLPTKTGENGEPRCVGVELEFGSISSEEAARALQAALGGRLVVEEEHLCRVTGTPLGELTVKLDTRLAHKGDDEGDWIDGVSAFFSNLVGKAGSLVLPVEVTTEPLGASELARFEEVIEVLRRAGASGTRGGTFYAFALQLNPQTPSREPDAILAIMKAFVVLNAWLRATLHPKTLRKALRFVEPYPHAYRERLTDPEYWPRQAEMIDDYLADNPTRNRDLDMLPLFLHLDEERVRRSLPDEKINGRPTFHYRLPGSHLGDPEWTLASVWRTWVAVEALAADRERLQRACAAYRDFDGDKEAWAERAREFALREDPAA